VSFIDVLHFSWRLENTFEIHLSRSCCCTSRSFGRVRVSGDADLSPAFCIGCAGRFGLGSVLNSVTPEQEVRW
jgi:Zn-dependent alcohol dehydrogenase